MANELRDTVDGGSAASELKVPRVGIGMKENERENTQREKKKGIQHDILFDEDVMFKYKRGSYYDI